MPDTLTSLADMVKINDVSVRDAGATDIFNGRTAVANSKRDRS